MIVIGLILVLGVHARVVTLSSPPRCEKITAPMCQKLGYNTTLMPNFMGHDDQREAALGLQEYAALLQHDCSPFLRLFVCSVFVPLCSEHVPGAVPACRGLCEEVRNDCLGVLLRAGLLWPVQLNCSRFPEPPNLCMQHPSEEEATDHGVVPTNELPVGDHFQGLKSTAYTCQPDALSKKTKCLKTCLSQDGKNKFDEVLFEVWIIIWSLISILVTTFSLLTFLSQPKRFRWPARPILYLSFCGFFRGIIFIVRWTVGPFTCSDDIAVENPTDSLMCTTVALLLVYIDIATSVWWCVFCFVWYLSAAKEWSTEALKKISTRLHAATWTLSAGPLIIAIITKNLQVNEFTRLCEISSYALTVFQLCFVVLGCFLAVWTSVALKNVRKALVCAGRSPFKLERLIWRLGIISVGISVPLLVSILCIFFHSFVAVLLKIGMQFLSVIFASFWVFSSKTFKSWNKILKPPLRNKNANNVSVAKV